MDDRTLLELAAKAAGMNYLIWTPGASPIVPAGHRVGGRSNWCPLADDGDALRLAVKLEMQVCIGVRRIDSTIVGDEDGQVFRGMEAKAGDIYAATRRAIVRAAAAIGKEM